MKSHSIYFENKNDFISKNKSLSDEHVAFYKSLFSAQEKASGMFPENIKDQFPVNPAAVPFLQADDIRLNDEILDTLSLLLDDITESIVQINPGLDFNLLKKSFSSSAQDMIRHLVKKDYDYFTALGMEWRIDTTELLFVIHNVFKPLLVKARIEANLSIDKENWQEGECPFCGYLPDFSKLVESKNNLRKLHCSLCENEWEFPRLKCHSCGTDEQTMLGFFEYEDNPEYRVYYCDKCRNYLKAIHIPKLRDESGFDLAVEDIITGFLDSTMMNKNYNRS